MSIRERLNGNEAVAYAKQRKQFGRRLIDFEMVQAMLADMAIKTEAARVHENTCKRQMAAGEMERKDGAIVKTFQMIYNFFGLTLEGQKLEVTNGGTLSLGNHQLTFVFAPMVHWPEVMVTYGSTD